MDIKNIDIYLRKNDIKPSYQRKRILEYMLENHNYPTVNQIYEALEEEIPTLSKTTVYNTLNVFIEKKLIEVITIDEKEAHYGIFNPNFHAYFKCEMCNKIYDINLHINENQAEDLNKFIVKEQYIHLKGICPNCISKQV